MASIIKRKSKYSVIYSYDDENGEKRQKWETWGTLAALGFGNVLMTCVFSCVEEVVPPGAFLLLSSRGQPPHLIADENAQKFGVEENFFSFSLIRIIFSFNVDEAMPIILVISFC